jgi:pentatricopeptide repeat protein
MAPLNARNSDQAPQVANLQDEDELDLDTALDEMISLLEVDDDMQIILSEDADAVLTGAKTAEASGDVPEPDEIHSLLALMDRSPIGTIGDDQILLFRNTLHKQLALQNSGGIATQTEQEMHTVLIRMLDEYDAASKSKKTARMKFLEPRTEDFQFAMKAWKNSQANDASVHISRLHFRQDEIFMEDGICPPNLETIQMVLDSLASSRERGADRKAWTIVDRLELYKIEPTPEIYAALIASVGRSRAPGSANRAEKILDQALKMFPPSIRDGVYSGVTVDSFNVVMTAWAKSEKDDGSDRAAKLLLRMEQEDQNRGIVKPNVSSFTSLIDAYAQKNTWEGACQAERTLNALLNYFLEEEDESLEPNIATWGIVLSCWYRVSKKGSRDAASKAAALLSRMEELYESGRLSYGPDAIAYVTVMNAWAASKNKEIGPDRSEAMLDEMSERYMDGDESFKPTAKSVRNVVEAWINSERQESVFKAEEIFERYEDLGIFSDELDKDPLAKIFKALLFGWSKNCDPERAHDYLIEMVERGLQPDCFCFDKVIEAYNKEEEPYLDEVKAVLELMEEQNATDQVKPNERIYTSYIRSLIKANVPDLAKSAFLVLEKMKGQYNSGNKGMKPTVFSYNAVLKACSVSVTDDDASNRESFKVALNTFNELRTEQENPDHVSYGNLLRCAMLLPEGPQRDATITTTFQLCCKNGFVNSYVLRDLQDAAPEVLWRELCRCSEGDVVVESLPESWRHRFFNNKR